MRIAPKAFEDFTPEEYHAYVSGMYYLKPSKSVSTGLNVKRLKSGKLSITRRKPRTFAYVTYVEVEEFAQRLGATQTEIWNAFRERDFILAKSRLEAENIYTSLQDNLGNS